MQQKLSPKQAACDYGLKHEARTVCILHFSGPKAGDVNKTPKPTFFAGTKKTTPFDFYFCTLTMPQEKQTLQTLHLEPTTSCPLITPHTHFTGRPQDVHSVHT